MDLLPGVDSVLLSTSNSQLPTEDDSWSHARFPSAQLLWVLRKQINYSKAYSDLRHLSQARVGQVFELADRCSQAAAYILDTHLLPSRLL